MRGDTCPKLFVVTVLLLLFGAAACNISNPYKRSNFIPAHVNTVYVFTFLNETKYPNLQELLRRNLEQEVSRSGAIALGKELRFADAVLEGRINKLFLQEINRTPAGLIDQARYCLVLDFSLKDVKKNEYLMTNQPITVIRKVSLQTPPVDDLNLVRESMVSNITFNVVRYCTTGERDDFNLMYGFEDKPLIDDDGTLIGKPAANYDVNNDGIDDRLQGLTNTGTGDSGK
jgi:hypothetical protein